MNNNKPLLPVKSDFVFKLIFGDQRNVDILAAFLKSVLDIPNEEYDHLTVVDPYVKKESEDDKYGILDVKVHTISGSVVHVEIQVKVIPELTARTIYSQSKLVAEQMSSGQKFSTIKRVVSIIITDENFVPGEDYHHRFRYRTNDGMEFTNLVEIDTLELRKLPSDDDSTDLWYWMKFIQSDDEGVMEMLAQRSPTMKKAVGVLKELSADERTRMLFESREMARMDFESMKDGAVKSARIDVARNLLEMNLSVEQIAKATGLTLGEIDALTDKGQ
ncbi:MAG: Rpn family recombination-promoting nuclease/putative transposase [Oscillospiraceae bacterium]|jgi:predicted transposase/invertase (TIGR01784 family)|nr:Rpn family recombination-promoting nuclease/putative transposase [Oscillospiraceae bacterium]